MKRIGSPNSQNVHSNPFGEQRPKRFLGKVGEPAIPSHDLSRSLFKAHESDTRRTQCANTPRKHVVKFCNGHMQ